MAKFQVMKTILEMNSHIVTLDKYKKQAVSCVPKEADWNWEKGTLDSSLYGIWHFRNKPYDFKVKPEPCWLSISFQRTGIWKMDPSCCKQYKRHCINPERGSWTDNKMEKSTISEPNFINIEYAFKKIIRAVITQAWRTMPLKPKLLTFPM